MAEDYRFLPFFLQEEIYVLKSEQAEQAASPEEAENETLPDGPTIFGKNQQQIMILTDSFGESEKSFLEKILQAVKLSFDDIALIEQQQLQDFSQLKGIPYESLISFGVQNEQFLQNFPAYSVRKKGGKQVLLADSLQLLVEDKKKKALLWANLQQMFL